MSTGLVQIFGVILLKLVSNIKLFSLHYPIALAIAAQSST